MPWRVGESQRGKIRELITMYVEKDIKPEDAEVQLQSVKLLLLTLRLVQQVVRKFAENDELFVDHAASAARITGVRRG
jgi:hypothetical protein